ncbi:phage head closure protein [Roseinatronobacter sp.]|uniref:phage head closure protein n=1 Tax=Roseinatronobacter sp. TaxID=1945755 RepID=UPI003F6EA619
MQAGTLQHPIELQRLSETLNPARQAVQTWTTYATGRAELRQAGVSEFLTTFGEGVSNNAVFVIRWLPGVSVSDRIVHAGKVWNIVALAEIGRRRGLELRAVAA